MPSPFLLGFLPCGGNVGVDVGEVSLQGRRASTDPAGRLVNRADPPDLLELYVPADPILWREIF